MNHLNLDSESRSQTRNSSPAVNEWRQVRLGRPRSAHMTSYTPQPSPRDRSRAGASANSAKPVITHGQRVREAFILQTAQQMSENYFSTVLEVKVLHGRRVMWTSIPEDLKHVFNCTDIKTVDSWKQTMHGDVQLDISMFKPGDKVKMTIQSVGVSGKHCHQPLMRGVPDTDVHSETLVPLIISDTPREQPVTMVPQSVNLLTVTAPEGIH